MTSPAETARSTAADLFAEAGRRLDLPALTRLECLAAERALQVASVPRPDMADLPSEELIHSALRTLGQVPFADFCDPRIRDAARHGRQALRERPPWTSR
jgi:hypothetical protein